MVRRPPRASRGTAFVAGTVLLLSGLIAAPAAAVPSQDDIDRVVAEASSTEEAIAHLEVMLAANNALAEEVAIEAAIATEAYLVAEAELAAAQEEEAQAAAEKASADEELHAAANALAAIAVASYRNGGELNELEVFFTSNGVENALSAKSFLQRRGEQTDGLLQRHEAAEVVANLAAERAAEATASREEAAADLEAKALSAQARSDEAAAAVADTEAQRGRLLMQLADLRNTTVEMEAQRQAELDRQRIERENSVARNNVTERATESAAESAGSQAPSPEHAVPPANAPSQNATTQEPATSAPSSAPTTPAPRPTTQRPTTPAPTTPAPTTPRPTTPAPSPTTQRPTTPAPTTPAPRPTTQRPTTPAPTTPPPAPAPSKPAPQPTTPPPPAPAPSGKGEIALAWARTQLGKPYVYGAAGPNSYDCSGLTMRAFQQAGINLPRNSAAQYHAGSKVSVNNLRPGDLIFYSNNGSPSGIYHVAIYAGNGMRLHAPSPGKTVELVPMWWANVLPLAVRL